MPQVQGDLEVDERQSREKVFMNPFMKYFQTVFSERVSNIIENGGG